MADVIVLDDDQSVVRAVAQALRASGYSTVGIRTTQDALNVVTSAQVRAVIVEPELRNELGGLEIFRAIRRDRPGVIGIALTSCPSCDSALKCGQAGISKYLVKPCYGSKLLSAMQSALRSTGAPPGRPPDESTSSQLLRYLHESAGCKNGHEASELTALLLRVLVDGAVSIPIFLACAIALGRLLTLKVDEIGDSSPVSMNDSIRTELQRLIKINVQPRSLHVANVLRQFESAADAIRLREIELANQMRLSPSHLGRRVHAATGFHVRDLARAGRMKPVMRTIIETQQPIGKAALSGGYTDVRQFTRDFASIFAMNSRTLRKRLQVLR